MFVEVDPPTETPVQLLADTLDLCKGLTAEESDNDHFRCSNCHDMKVHQQYRVWVPDEIRMTDSAEAITEICRLRAWNGHFSAWCIDCAKQLGKPKLLPPLWTSQQNSYRSFSSTETLALMLFGSAIAALCAFVMGIVH